MVNTELQSILLASGSANDPHLMRGCTRQRPFALAERAAETFGSRSLAAGHLRVGQQLGTIMAAAHACRPAAQYERSGSRDQSDASASASDAHARSAMPKCGHRHIER